jgi:hypothetical protein
MKFSTFHRQYLVSMFHDFRKNRNMYAQVLLAMLKRDLIEEPFSQQPEHGPLPTMPAYMVSLKTAS